MTTPLPVEPTEPTPAKPPEPQAVSPSPVPAEPVEEPFDKDRAMRTIQQLREIEKKAKQDNKELERLKADEQKRLDAQLSETERLTKQATELKAQNDRLHADILRRDVITETGLPAVFADRLKGTTKEEMLADANELLKAIPAQNPKPPTLKHTNPDGAITTKTDAQRAEEIFGKRLSIYDIDAIRAAGGGVVFKKE